MKTMLRLSPLLLIFGLIAVLWRGLYSNPKEIPSPLINKLTPSFELPNLFDPQENLNNELFQGKITILNVWASWCATCVEEQTFIRSIAPSTSVQWIGLNYKDNREEAIAWLKQYGNPYSVIAADTQGVVALDWGIYGTPETFVIDRKSQIRYKHIGPINSQDWQTDFVPLLTKLSREVD